jgi:hypothetical protein
MILLNIVDLLATLRQKKYNIITKCITRGRLHVLPECFEFSSVDVFQALKQWWLGNDGLNYPPYKRMTSMDLQERRSCFPIGML